VWRLKRQNSLWHLDFLPEMRAIRETRLSSSNACFVFHLVTNTRRLFGPLSDFSARIDAENAVSQPIRMARNGFEVVGRRLGPTE
jgi:hypothetical protein